MERESPATSVVARAARWPDVQVVDRADGGTAFRLHDRELGHVHGTGRLDVRLTPALRDQVLTDGLADRHRPPHDRSWVSYLVRDRSDVGGAIRLLRLGYLHHLLDLRTIDPTVAATVRPERELRNLEVGPELRALLGSPRATPPEAVSPGTPDLTSSDLSATD